MFWRKKAVHSIDSEEERERASVRKMLDLLERTIGIDASSLNINSEYEFKRFLLEPERYLSDAQQIAEIKEAASHIDIRF